MKRKNLVAPLLLLMVLISSCKEDEPRVDDKNIDNRPPEEVVETLTESLATADSISTFTNALKVLTLDKEDVAQGLTIFAPLDEASTNNSRKASSGRFTASANDTTGLTEEILKDHIVKGVLKFTDLTDGKMFNSLSGKSFKITKKGSRLFINGVPILPKEALSGTKETVFVVESILSNTAPTDTVVAASTSLTIAVYSAAQWSPETPEGKPSTEADIVLYRSYEDYANGNPAYQATTGADGKAVFNDIEPGTYYIEASKDTLSNIFAESVDLIDGVYTGIAIDGIFQTQEEVENSYQSDAAVGKIKWLDANADGLINDEDRISLPYESAQAEADKDVVVSILIGPDMQESSSSFPVLGPEELGLRMEEAEVIFSDWYFSVITIDALLSDDADTPPTGANLPGIDNFAFGPTTPSIAYIWNAAYSNINNLNLIIANEPENTELLANAIGLRAYTYLTLTTYFGSIPLITQYNNQENLSSSTREEVLNFVTDELLRAHDLFSSNASTLDNTHLNLVSIKALLAKAALLKKDYNAVGYYTDEITMAASYQLAPPVSIFDANNPETIWLHSFTSEAMSDYFFSHQTLSIIRLTKVYLMHAEANIELGKFSDAQNSINALLVRKGSPETTAITQEELRAALRALWKSEMPKEGNRFANLVRWEMAPEILGGKGFMQGKHEVLPIPQVIIDQNPNIFQNPGY